MITISNPTIVEKGWGAEVVVVNNDQYCGKLLEFKSGETFSDHFHLKKHETFFILTGRLMLWYYDLTTADRKGIELKEGMVVTIPQGNPHQIKALEDSVIVEFSTHHEDDDSYRIRKGSSQNGQTKNLCSNENTEGS